MCRMFEWREKKDWIKLMSRRRFIMVNSGLITLQFPFGPLKHASDFKDHDEQERCTANTKIYFYWNIKKLMTVNYKLKLKIWILFSCHFWFIPSVTVFIFISLHSFVKSIYAPRHQSWFSFYWLTETKTNWKSIVCYSLANHNLH